MKNMINCCLLIAGLMFLATNAIADKYSKHAYLDKWSDAPSQLIDETDDHSGSVVFQKCMKEEPYPENLKKCPPWRVLAVIGFDAQSAENKNPYSYNDGGKSK